MSNSEVIAYLEGLADSEIATHSLRYFKTGKGEYGYGDKFLGIRVPVLRKVAKSFQGISKREISILLKSEYHEARLLSLLILVGQFSAGDENRRNLIYNLYLKHTKYINNWDLVDTSAPNIVGAWLIDRGRSKLYELAGSTSLWERRISIISTLYFIRNGDYSDTLKLAEILITDSEDLIHKAVGWMLREIGNRDRAVEEKYLKKHYKQMPRTMLRYSIEKFSKDSRQRFLKGDI